MIPSPLSARIADSVRFFCVGSLPYADPVTAVEFVLERPFILPFWPELPNRAGAESMVSKSARALSDIWEGYNEDEARSLYVFKERLLLHKKSPGLLKCQVLGPISILEFCLSQDVSFSSGLRLARAACLKQIEWQVEFFSDLHASLLFVLDEPGLINWRRLEKEQQAAVSEAYSFLQAAISELGGYLGIHSCAAFEAEFLTFPFELFSFDLCQTGIETVLSTDTRSAWELALRRGVVVAPGTYPAVANDNFDALLDSGSALFEEFSGALGALYPQVIVLRSATCGHAGAGVEWVEALYKEFG